MSGLPIDYIGFVFAPSKRRVSPDEAGLWIGETAEAFASRGTDPDDTARFVGVFVNPTMSELDETLHAAPIHVVQLHGEESADFCRAVKDELEVRVWKVFDAEQAAQTGEVARLLAPYAGVIDAVMLDTAGGGSGRTFRWEAIPAFRDWAGEHGLPLVAAGGLHEDNVSDLIERYRPDVVDVSSGVETDGVKDLNKIQRFVERVKSHHG